MEGLVLFNKPKGKTSYAIVEYFKKITKNKVGHGGTLDPFAEGLLILGIGEYTKELYKFLQESTKTYIAEIELGKISNTYDIEGEIKKINKNDRQELLNNNINLKLYNNSCIPDNINKIKKVLTSFIGEIEQIPPPFSAVKIKGKPAYQYAREGKEIKLKTRKVKIYEIKVLEYDPPILKIETIVGSGAYIRSLAHDIGQKLGCGAYLRNLLRTKINEFDLSQALTFTDIEKDYLEFYAKIYGRVQGVGFRFFTENYAQEFNINGYVKNLIDGTVLVLAQGREKDLQKFIFKLKQGPRLSQVERLEIVFRKPLNIFSDFKIAF